MSMAAATNQSNRHSLRGTRATTSTANRRPLNSSAALRPLLHAQRFQRINARGAAGGKVASQQCDAKKQERYARIGEWVGGADSVEQIPRHARDGQRH